MDYIIFDTEAEAQTAVDTCWIQYVKDQVTAGYTAGNGTTYTDLTGISDATIKTFKLLNKINYWKVTTI